MPYEDRTKLFGSLFSVKVFVSVKEIFLECLIHRKIFKKNALLGYMHMSIAFGWFMMILLAHIEVKLFCPHRFNLPYYPIFFRYFTVETESTLKGAFFFFLMDFFLLITLSGVGLAMFKRIRSRVFGMKRTTRLKLGDTLAMYALWAIFPLRLLAESFTSSAGGGSFLTNSFGHLIENFVSNDLLMRPAWWLYSIALGIFFFALPHSRYMHIPTEILLIVLRNAGIKSHNRPNDGYARAEIYSCSRCGICIDACQMVSAAQMERKATVYFMHHLRYRYKLKSLPSTTFNCMMCGRCVQACPVGIDSCKLKQMVRNLYNNIPMKDRYSYIPEPVNVVDGMSVEVMYFAGCMSHLTPDIKRAMLKIFRAANVKYRFMDEDGGICCGRPTLLTGQSDAAHKLMQKNKNIITASGAKALVASCPICYKMFKNEYRLTIPVLHHTQYINQLLDNNKLHLTPISKKLVFHDPCDLARNSGVYEEPREVLRKIAELQPTPFDKEKGLCCGGSLGNAEITQQQRKMIAYDTVEKLMEQQPDILVTACPLCKKTLADTKLTTVQDIAQVVGLAIDEYMM
jgi:Fe-S oxidoreductase